MVLSARLNILKRTRRWQVLGGAVLLGGLAGGLGMAAWTGRTDAHRLTDPSFERVETRLGRRLYAPTWLPAGMTPVKDLTQVGHFRVLTNYEDRAQQHWLILAQEPRNPDRDAYHTKALIPHTDVEATVGTERAYFMRGRSGDRRLLWRTADTWLVASSFQLSDLDLLKIAQSVRSVDGPAGKPGASGTPQTEGSKGNAK